MEFESILNALMTLQIEFDIEYIYIFCAKLVSAEEHDVGNISLASPGWL